jgi:hypothetical protein
MASFFHVIYDFSQENNHCQNTLVKYSHNFKPQSTHQPWRKREALLLHYFSTTSPLLLHITRARLLHMQPQIQGKLTSLAQPPFSIQLLLYSSSRHLSPASPYSVSTPSQPLHISIYPHSNLDRKINVSVTVHTTMHQAHIIKVPTATVFVRYFVLVTGSTSS